MLCHAILFIGWIISCSGWASISPQGSERPTECEIIVDKTEMDRIDEALSLIPQIFKNDTASQDLLNDFFTTYKSIVVAGMRMETGAEVVGTGIYWCAMSITGGIGAPCLVTYWLLPTILELGKAGYIVAAVLAGLPVVGGTIFGVCSVYAVTAGVDYSRNAIRVNKARGNWQEIEKEIGELLTKITELRILGTYPQFIAIFDEALELFQEEMNRRAEKNSQDNRPEEEDPLMALRVFDLTYF